MTSIPDLMSLFGPENTIMGQLEKSQSYGRQAERESLQNQSQGYKNTLEGLLANSPQYQDAYLKGNIGAQQQQEALGGKQMMDYEKMKQTLGPEITARIGAESAKATKAVLNTAYEYMTRNPTADGTEVGQMLVQTYPDMFNTPQGQKILQQYAGMPASQIMPELLKARQAQTQFDLAGDLDMQKKWALGEQKIEGGLEKQGMINEAKMAEIAARGANALAAQQAKAKSTGTKPPKTAEEALMRQIAEQEVAGQITPEQASQQRQEVFNFKMQATRQQPGIAVNVDPTGKIQLGNKQPAQPINLAMPLPPTASAPPAAQAMAQETGVEFAKPAATTPLVGKAKPQSKKEWVYDKATGKMIPK